MSQPIFPRIYRWLSSLGLIQQSTVRKSSAPRPRTLKPGLERYDFADTGQIGELTDQIKRGELPQPKPSAEVDFGSYSPVEAARRLKEKMGLKTYKGPIPEPTTHRLSSSPLQESLVADIKDWPVYERDAGPDFARVSGPSYSTSLVKDRPIAKPEEISPSFARRSGYTENYQVGLKTYKETMPKPREFTIKDLGAEEQKKERYWFFG